MNYEREIARLIAILRKTTSNYPSYEAYRVEQDEALAALVRTGKPAVPYIITALKRGRINEYIVATLCDIEYPHADALLKYVANKAAKPLYRLFAVMSLATCENQSDILTVFLYILGDKTDHPQVRAAVAGELMDLKWHNRKLALRTLFEMAKSKSAGDRRYSVKQLQRLARPGYKPLRDKRLFDAFMRAANDKSDWVRVNGVIGLSALVDKRAIPMLAKRLKEKLWFVAENAAIALANISDEASLALLEDVYNFPNEYALDVVEVAVKVMGKKDIEYLRRVVRDGSDNIALMTTAIEILGLKKDVISIGYLIPLLNDARYGVRLNASEALGNIGHPRAIDPLKMRLNLEEDELVINNIEHALKQLMQP